MNIDRIRRVNELLKREISETIFRVVKADNFDLSALTITRVITSRNLRHARVMVSIRDNHGRRKSIMAALLRHRMEIQNRINNNLVLKYTPKLTFEIDHSLEKGDAILGILSELDDGSEGATEEDDLQPGYYDDPNKETQNNG